MKRMICFLAVLFSFLALPAHAQQTGTETFTIIDSSCTTATPCIAQIYQAVGASPASGIGTLTYTELATALVSTSVGSVNSLWTYVDSTPVVGKTYCYYATVTYSTAAGVSLGGPPSAPTTFALLIPVGTPAAPSTFTGVWTPTA